MKDQRDQYCLICGKEYDEIVSDGIRSYATCKNEDHTLRHEWHMFHYGGLRPPTFVIAQITVSFSDFSVFIDYELDEPLTMTILNQGINNIVNQYHSMKIPVKDLTIDFKDLRRIVKVITENYAFI